MKEKITNNFAFKILSIICAIILWTIIVNVYDPSTSKTVSGITVQLLNEEALTSKGYTYQVVDGSKISVNISGPRSLVSDITATDIIATANLSEVSGFADYVDIDVRVSKDGVSTSAIEVTPITTAIKLNIENRETASMNIELDVIGEPASGYNISSRQVLPSSIKITGASSSVASVTRARITYDVSNATADINTVAAIRLYDVNGNEVDISANSLELSKTEAEIKIVISKSKPVPINFASSGVVATGYAFTGIESNITEAVISGDDTIIDGINSVDIPGSAIDIANLTADRTYSINISRYLPEGVELLSDSNVTATAKISAYTDREISVPLTMITFTNLAQTSSAVIDAEGSLTVTVRCPASLASSINAASLKPSIDLTGITEQTSSFKVNFTLPNNCSISQEFSVPVVVTRTNGNNQQQTQAATQPVTQPASSTANN